MLATRFQLSRDWASTQAHMLSATCNREARVFPNGRAHRRQEDRCSLISVSRRVDYVVRVPVIDQVTP